MSALPLPALLVGRSPAIRTADAQVTEFGHRIRCASRDARLMCNRLSKGTPYQRAMSQRGKRCLRRDPCKEPWCTRCLCIAQQNIVRHVAVDLREILHTAQAKAITAGRKLPKAWTVSAVDERMAVPRGKLSPRAIKNQICRIVSCLENSGLRNSIGFFGLDISLNVEKHKAPEWQPQFYGIIFSRSRNLVRRALNPAFPKPGRKWAKPIKVTELPEQDIAYAAAYVLKPNAVRRERYLGKNGRMQTAKWALKANEKDELATFLQELGPDHRLLIHNVRIVGGHLVRKPPPPLADQRGILDPPR